MNNQQEPAMSLNLGALGTRFDLLALRGDEQMDEFYSRLFAVAAPSSGCSPDDLRRQKAMLLAALVLVRKSPRDLDAIATTLRRLGACHVAYGAKPEHYPIVGRVLIGSMAEIAGDARRPEHEHAWATSFELVTATMLEGVASARLADAA